MARENFVDDLFLAEGPEFLEQGHTIVDINEALWLCQEKAKETHRAFIIHIFNDQLSIVKLIKLVRKFVIHLEPTPEFVSSRKTANEAKSMITFMTNLHGFGINSVEDGVAIEPPSSPESPVIPSEEVLIKESVEYRWRVVADVAERNSTR